MPNFPVRVTLRPSGHEFTVDEGETVLAAAMRAGVGLPYGCKNGACGTCKSRLLSGSVVHGNHSASALTAEEQAAGSALLCCARPQGDLMVEVREVAGAGDFPARKMPCRIERIERTADVAVVTLKLPAADRLRYRAGQYLEFILKDGARRSYSIATAPHDEGPIELHIRHMPGGVFTDALFGAGGFTVKERDLLRIEAPLGTFFLRDDNPRPIVLLASGTGFAPIKAIAETIFFRDLNRDDPVNGLPAQPVVLYWGCRKRADLYRDELPRRWELEQPNFRYVPVLSEATPDDQWSGRTGFVHRAVMQDLPDLSGHQVYACGVPIMVDSARRDFVAHCGLPPEQFFADAFTSQADLAAA
jgi:CDP-4-dehydro-6-deoxyglucose reductase